MTEDYEKIRQLSYEYTYLLDRGDFAGVGELLGGGRLTMTWFGVQGPWMTGPEIADFYATEVCVYDHDGQLVPPGTKGNPLTRHVISNHSIYLDGDAAVGKSYFQVLQQPPGGPIQIIISGRYEDRFERRGGAWRFTEKNIIGDYLNDVSYHGRRPERIPD